MIFFIFSAKKKQREKKSNSFIIARLCCELKIISDDEVLEQAAQKGCGCPIPRSFQGQIGWGFLANEKALWND